MNECSLGEKMEAVTEICFVGLFGIIFRINKCFYKGASRNFIYLFLFKKAG
jgi:hypothetical protein